MAFGDIASWFKNLVKKVMSPILNLKREERIGDIIAEAIKRNFVNSSAPSGDPWAELKYRDGKPLILTGNLMENAINAGRHASVNGNVIEAHMDDPFYGVFHQYGTHVIPQREFFGVDQQGIDEIAEEIVNAKMTFIVEGNDE